MKILVHAAPSTLEGYRHPNLGVLSSPRRFYRDVEGWDWAADNDAFSAWDAVRYQRMIEAIADLPRPLFVTLPDVVGDHAATLRLAALWWGQLHGRDLPVGFVAQDGLTVSATPWESLEALFIGGTTEFKMGNGARELVEEAKARGLHVHMGRVNGHQRLRYAKAIGCDSIDGTSFSWFKDRWLREFLDHAAAPAQGILA